MDEGLLKVIQNFKVTSHKRRCTDHDFVDRLNKFYSPILLIIFAVVICTKSYIVGNPLQCWIPAHFSGGWEAYSESYCFIKNTYFFRDDVEHIPKDETLRRQQELKYYQWIPFVLALQAALFMVPSYFWRILNFQGRIHLKPIIERAVMLTFKSGEERIKEVKNIAEHMHICLFQTKGLPKRARLKRLVHNTRKKCFGLGGLGYYLSLAYIIMKILVILNIILQFYITKEFLKTNLFYGIGMAQSFHNGTNWKQTGLFPRVTYCDIKMAKLGQIHPYTLQCVLVINLFNEKIYFFIWFWFLFMFALNIINFFVWLFKMIFGKGLANYCSKNDMMESSDKKRNLESCQQDMTPDASFTLRMIETNCGKLTTKAIVNQLINFYAPQPPPEKDSPTDNTDKNDPVPVDDNEADLPKNMAPPAYQEMQPMNKRKNSRDTDTSSESKKNIEEMENFI